MSILVEQQLVCARVGASLLPSPLGLKVGIARTVLTSVLPINGLRHPPVGDTTGWYIWAGEDFPADDGFVPLHVEHLDEWCPGALPYLGLAPGWRFLIAPGHEDIWFDIALLNVD